MAVVPTVKVKRADGTFAVINESDFDPEQHDRNVESGPEPLRRRRGRPRKEHPPTNSTPEGF